MNPVDEHPNACGAPGRRSVLRIALRHRDLVVLLLAGEVESLLALDDAWFRIGPDQLSTPTLHSTRSQAAAPSPSDVAASVKAPECI
jgi:hypothetical protein